MSLATTTLWSLGVTLKRHVKDLSAVSNFLGMVRAMSLLARFDRGCHGKSMASKKKPSTRASLLGSFPMVPMVPGLPPKWHQKTHPRDEWRLQQPVPAAPCVVGCRGFGKPTEGAFEAFLKWHDWGPAWRRHSRHSRPLGPSWGRGRSVTPKKTTNRVFFVTRNFSAFYEKKSSMVFFCRFSKIWYKKKGSLNRRFLHQRSWINPNHTSIYENLDTFFGWVDLRLDKPEILSALVQTQSTPSEHPQRGLFPFISHSHKNKETFFTT